MLIDSGKRYAAGTNQPQDKTELAGSIHSQFSLVKKYSAITAKTLAQWFEQVKGYSMNNILYDIYKRYSANAWLSPFERALVRFLKMMVITFIVGALPALGSAAQSINATGGLDSFSWNGVIQAVIFGGTVSVLATLWKYGNAKEEASGGAYPANEAGKSIEQQIVDTLEHVLPNALANLSAQPTAVTTPPVDPVQAKAETPTLVVKTEPGVGAFNPVSMTTPITANSPLFNGISLVEAPASIASSAAINAPVSTDGASDAATPNKTAGAGYDGGMGQPLPDEVDAHDTWLLDTVVHPSLPVVPVVAQPNTGSATATPSISA